MVGLGSAHATIFIDTCPPFPLGVNRLFDRQFIHRSNIDFRAQLIDFRVQKFRARSTVRRANPWFPFVRDILIDLVVSWIENVFRIRAEIGLVFYLLRI